VDWVNKLHVEVIDEEDGGCTIQIDWDDTDPDLEEWSSWGEEGQRAFVMDALRNALDSFQDLDLAEDSTDYNG